jgi:hypothetical protein
VTRVGPIARRCTSVRTNNDRTRLSLSLCSLAVDGLTKAQELAKRAVASYATIKREVEGRVVRWEWATFSRHSHEPNYFEASNVARGRLLKSVEGKKEKDQHGFDAQDRLIVERRFYKELCHETFILIEPEGIASYYFSTGGAESWTNVRWFSVDERGVYAIDSVYSSGGYRSRRYSFDEAGRVAGYEERSEKADGFDARDFEYDRTGQLVRVYFRYADGRRTLYFERAPKKETLAAMRGVLLDGLYKAATSAISALTIDERVFAIVVHWTDSDSKKRLPPEIAIGLEKADIAPMKVYPYDPTEWEHPSVGLNLDKSFAELCTCVNADIHQNNKQKAADGLFADLARALGEHRWSFAKTRDFVSYALNHDGPPAAKQAAKFRAKK